jgi:hypothetical protein
LPAFLIGVVLYTVLILFIWKIVIRIVDVGNIIQVTNGCVWISWESLLRLSGGFYNFRQIKNRLYKVESVWKLKLSFVYVWSLSSTSALLNVESYFLTFV